MGPKEPGARIRCSGAKAANAVRQSAANVRPLPLPGRANGSIANLRGQGPRAEAARRGSCRAYCRTATRDLQLP